ncbi:hypothetical protein [Pseudooceanicola nanhaiensis]|uniref:hypothetical protein n=1 Tax=Pseudooceanicola nanhaiensis TaxID=375761 RepID=UPI001CD21DE7|nr:hypothetical protein [Pseudooceanicola nanhaiensis]MCA0921076.1 hypothetical protein [Pseudooceanicola nanhaiensis]
MMTRFLILSPLLLAACAGMQAPEPTAPGAMEAAPVETPLETAAEEMPADAAEDDALPGSDAIAPAAGSLGRTVASLGAPGEAGMWLKTPLVKAETPGRITYEGKTADVTLIPIPGEPGAGSRISLSAMQAIGAPLTGLPTLEVAAR